MVSPPAGLLLGKVLVSPAAGWFLV